MIYEREIIRLNWMGKAMVIIGAPITLTGVFTFKLVEEVGNAFWRAWWEVRWEWRKIRDFLR